MTGPGPIPPQVAGLWPAPARVETRRSTSSGQTGYFVIPTLKRPRYLVPTDVPGAARMFARHGGSRVDRVARGVWRRAHRSGIASRLPLARLAVSPDAGSGIEAYLAEALGRPISIGVLLGPPRANQKPVIQIFSAAGETIAFAKLGLTPMSAGLLAAEAAALGLLADASPRTFAAPALLHHGTWNGVPILVQQALPLAQSGNAVVGAPTDVMVEIAGLAGISTARLGGSDYVGSVSPGDDDSWNGIDIRPFRRLYDALHDVGEVGLGCWHGDFGPWNMGSDGRTTQVWDWERFADGVPVGLDAAHYRTQRGVAAQTDPAEAWRLITADVASVLRAADLDAAQAPAVGAAYLLAIVARYRGDVAGDPTAALRRRMSWLAQVSALALPHVQEPSS